MKKNIINKIILILFVAVIFLVIKCSKSNAENNFVAQAYIDSPVYTTEIGKINLLGWVMTNDVDSKIEVYIDNNKSEIIEAKRVDREDVLKAIKGYGTEEENPMPGVNYVINAKNINNGIHTLSLRVISSQNIELIRYDQQFFFEKYKANMYLESPAQNGTVMSKTSKIWGWRMSDDPKSYIKILVNGVEQPQEKIVQSERKDVIKAIKGYGTEEENPTPGFEYGLDLSNLQDGDYELKVQTVAENGEVLAQNTRTITIRRYVANTYIDYPTQSIFKGDINVIGWVMSTDEKSEIKVYLDNVETEILEAKRVDREDVLKAVKGYGTEKENPKPGFNYTVNTSKLKGGIHRITVKVISRENKVIAEYSNNIFVEEPRARMNIESPDNSTVISKDVKIWGWAMCNYPESTINIYVDNKKYETEIKRTERNDVIKAVKNYGTDIENPMPGYEATIDFREALDGIHKIRVEVLSSDGTKLTENTRNVRLKKYNTMIYVEEPTKRVYDTDTINVGGWYMSELKEKNLVIRLDDKIIENVSLGERQDVIDAIKDCGDAESNLMPGFYTEIDISGYVKGNHELKIQVVSDANNEIIEEQIVPISFINKIKKEVITYGYSGAYVLGAQGGSELQCYKFGDGPNVFFATFCVHGYEDSWKADGEVLINIANKFYDKLITDQEADLAAKWTIYVFPEVNPDGRRMGYTGDGPGRTTIYSRTGRGIDINRSWQTGSEYVTYNSNRNYNGTEGFQAFEAEYLRNFLLEHKSKNGQTVLVDLHGWEDQLIGNEEICQYYKEQYPSCSTRNYGNYGVQYIISWARLNLGAKTALIEMPKARNDMQVLQMNLYERYIDATFNMLRGV